MYVIQVFEFNLAALVLISDEAPSVKGDTDQERLRGLLEEWVFAFEKRTAGRHADLLGGKLDPELAAQVSWAVKERNRIVHVYLRQKSMSRSLYDQATLDELGALGERFRSLNRRLVQDGARRMGDVGGENSLVTNEMIDAIGALFTGGFRDGVPDDWTFPGALEV